MYAGTVHPPGLLAVIGCLLLLSFESVDHLFAVLWVLSYFLFFQYCHCLRLPFAARRPVCFSRVEYDTVKVRFLEPGLVAQFVLHIIIFALDFCHRILCLLVNVFRFCIGLHVAITNERRERRGWLHVPARYWSLQASSMTTRSAEAARHVISHGRALFGT